MLPINFEGARWIGKPESMTDEECYGMPAKPGQVPSREEIYSMIAAMMDELPDKLPETRAEVNSLLVDAFLAAMKHIKPVHFFAIPSYHFIDQLNYPQWLTAWKPNVDDLKALNNGGAIWIKSLSEGLVPMAVFTMDESGNCND